MVLALEEAVRLRMRLVSLSGLGGGQPAAGQRADACHRAEFRGTRAASSDDARPDGALAEVGAVMIDLMGPGEIRRRTGERRVSLSPSFPEPVAELAQGRVWLADDVERWIACHRPELGRRAGDHQG